jgi:hypothetical protein
LCSQFFCVAPPKKKFYWKWIEHPTQEFFFWKHEKLYRQKLFFCKIDFFSGPASLCFASLTVTGPNVKPETKEGRKRQPKNEHSGGSPESGSRNVDGTTFGFQETVWVLTESGGPRPGSVSDFIRDPVDHESAVY